MNFTAFRCPWAIEMLEPISVCLVGAISNSVKHPRTTIFCANQLSWIRTVILCVKLFTNLSQIHHQLAGSEVIDYNDWLKFHTKSQPVTSLLSCGLFCKTPETLNYAIAVIMTTTFFLFGLLSDWIRVCLMKRSWFWACSVSSSGRNFLHLGVGHTASNSI